MQTGELKKREALSVIGELKKRRSPAESGESKKRGWFQSRIF